MGKGHGKKEGLTTSTVMCSAGPVVDGVDGGASRTPTATGEEEEEEELVVEAIGSA